MSISVIIPVYNREEKIRPCVNSVLVQGVDDMEVIIVDDGSTDGTPTICDNMAQNDKRIQVVHTTNGGPGRARNIGLNLASGEYVTFVDSDDTLRPGCYTTLLPLLKEHEEVDMLEYGVFMQSDSRLPVDLDDRNFRTPREYWFATKAWQHGYLWNKIWKRRVWEGIRIPDYRVFEDLYVVPLVVKRCRSIMTHHGAWYEYTWTDDSLTMTTHTQVRTHLLHIKVLMHAAIRMRVTPWHPTGRNMYYLMMCRVVDIIKSLCKR